MGSYKSNSSAEKMREMVLSLLLLPTLAMGQCANEMPSGACCDADGFFQEADPEACSFYYDCVEGTVSHRQCEPLSADGLPRVYDDVMDWCSSEKMLTVVLDLVRLMILCVPPNRHHQPRPQPLTVDMLRTAVSLGMAISQTLTT